MKIRVGFVSNSSSESFLIYGVAVDKKAITAEIEKMINETDLQIEYEPDNDYTKYVGKSWDSIGDFQTGMQFRTDIIEKCQKIFGENIVCETHARAWYNG